METGKERKCSVLKRLSMIPTSKDEEEDAPSGPKTSTAFIFTEVPSVIPFKFRIQLDQLDLYTKPKNDSPAFPSVDPTPRPGTPMPAKPLTPTLKYLVKLQIILRYQPHLDR